MKEFPVDIDSDCFENYFQNEVLPYLSDVETKRKKANKISKYLWPIVVSLFSFGLIVGALCEIDADSLLYRFLPEAFVDFFILFSVFALLFSILIFYFYDHIYLKQRKSIEYFIYNKLLSYFGDFRHEPKGSSFFSEDEIKSLIQDLYLFGKINKFNFYDSIYGYFNNKKIDICEIKLTPKELIDDVSCKECRGLFISTETNLNLSSNFTICKKDSRIKIELKNDLISLKTGNHTFDKLFVVYTDNHSVTSEVLTQDFVKEFLNIYYDLGLSFSCAFKNNKLYILILNDKPYKDWFSFDFCKESYLDSNTYKCILEDFLTILNVVDSFNKILKQNNKE